MSLDFYLYPSRQCPHCGHHISDGSYVFSANITHNLAPMAHAAGIYDVLWRPDELHDQDAAKVADDAWKEGRHEDAARIRGAIRPATAADLIPILREGLAKLTDPTEFRKYDSPNGWGKYDNFVLFVERVLAACEEHPTAFVKVSR